MKTPKEILAIIKLLPRTARVIRAFNKAEVQISRLPHSNLTPISVEDHKNIVRNEAILNAIMDASQIRRARQDIITVNIARLADRKHAALQRPFKSSIPNGAAPAFVLDHVNRQHGQIVTEFAAAEQIKKHRGSSN